MEKVEILLVEDNVNDAELAIRALRKNNITSNLLHLKDGVAALDYLFGRGVYSDRNINEKPKVIFLDLKMPKINGLEFLEQIKTNTLTKKIPVVVLTSSNERQDVEKSYLLGVNSYIVKPVEFEYFSKIIAEIGRYWMFINTNI